MRNNGVSSAGVLAHTHTHTHTHTHVACASRKKGILCEYFVLPTWVLLHITSNATDRHARPKRKKESNSSVDPPCAAAAHAIEDKPCCGCTVGVSIRPLIVIKREERTKHVAPLWRLAPG